MSKIDQKSHTIADYGCEHANKYLGPAHQAAPVLRARSFATSLQTAHLHRFQRSKGLSTLAQRKDHEKQPGMVDGLPVDVSHRSASQCSEKTQHSCHLRR